MDECQLWQFLYTMIHFIFYSIPVVLSYYKFPKFNRNCVFYSSLVASQLICCKIIVKEVNQLSEENLSTRKMCLLGNIFLGNSGKPEYTVCIRTRCHPYIMRICMFNAMATMELYGYSSCCSNHIDGTNINSTLLLCVPVLVLIACLSKCNV